LVVASSSADPDLAPFVGSAHLGSSFLIAGAAGQAPKLGFLTPMERDEAAATDLDLLAPEALGMSELLRETPDESERWSRLLERGLAATGIAAGRVGLAGRFPAGTLHSACSRLDSAGWSFLPGHELLRTLRKEKTATELEKIRFTSEATCGAFRRVAAILAAASTSAEGLSFEGSPLTAGRLRCAIRRICAESGLEQPHGNIVAGGRDAGVPHSQGADSRRLQAGEAIVVDLYPRGLLFADCTRTFCVGQAPEELSRAHSSVLTALRQAHESVRPGSLGWDLQLAACKTLASDGYSTPLSDPTTTRGYVHGLGHGVGFELHEYPSFRQGGGESGLLAQGDVFTLEPGLYDPEAGFGVRLEDLCHLGETGLELLTQLPYDLDPAAWA
jgi:Xaa-Pro aminopeptidase